MPAYSSELREVGKRAACWYGLMSMMIDESQALCCLKSSAYHMVLHKINAGYVLQVLAKVCQITLSIQDGQQEEKYVDPLVSLMAGRWVGSPATLLLGRHVSSRFVG